MSAHPGSAEKVPARTGKFPVAEGKAQDYFRGPFIGVHTRG